MTMSFNSATSHRSEASPASLQRLSHEARVRLPEGFGVEWAWRLLVLGLIAALGSVLTALIAGILHREGLPALMPAWLAVVAMSTGLVGMSLTLVGFFYPAAVMAVLRLRGDDPQAIMGDRRREKAAALVDFIRRNLDAPSLDTARRAAAAEISRFERRKLMQTLIGGAGAALAVIAKAMAVSMIIAIPTSADSAEAAAIRSGALAWSDWVACMGTAMAGGACLGLLAMLGYLDRLNRIVEALNEVDVPHAKGADVK